MSEKMIGRRFNRLLVLTEIESLYYPRNGRKGTYHHRYKCLCDCGKQVIVFRHNLIKKVTQSCGCLQRERRFTVSLRHGGAKNRKGSPTYRSWIEMKSRCYNIKKAHYHNYGGRGITVCDRWLNSFENFLADMGERPAGKTLDRYPNHNGNYELGNCRWATRKEQRNNSRQFTRTPVQYY